MVSALSGNPVTGIASGNISGRRAFDGGALTVCSGPVIEDGGGLYHLNAFTEDTVGNNIGFLFTASGCVPVMLTAITQQNVSGKLYPASGAFTQVASGTTYLASGSPVNVYSGQLSGHPVSPLSGAYVNSLPISGQVYVASGSITSGVICSGVFVTATATIASGAVYLASGTPVLVYSGQLSGHPVSPLSGAFTTSLPISGQVYLSSGQAVNLLSGNVVQVYSGNLSGQQVTSRTVTDKADYLIASGNLSGQVVTAASGAFTQVASGTTYLASGSVTSGVICSGVFVTATATVQSGQVYLASGSAVNLLSGNTVSVYSGQLSGHPVSPLSGAYVNSLPISGLVYLSSGQAVNLLSGNTVQVYSGNLSGQQLTARTVADKVDYLIASGNLSGQVVTAASGAFTQVASGTTYLASGSVTSGVICSGVFVTATATIASGQVYLASGSTVNLLSGNIVQVYSGNLSGQVVTAASGAFVTSLPISGQVYLSSGQAVNLLSGNIVQVYSGNLSGQQLTARTVTDKTGYTVNSGTTFLASGLPLMDSSGMLSVLSGTQVVTAVNLDKSGYTATPLSGTTYIASGPFVVGSITIASGTTFLASGSQVNLLSGNTVQLYSGQQTISVSGAFVVAGEVLDKSGYTAQTLSGTIYPASGVVGMEVLQWNFSGKANVSGQRNLMNAARKLVNAFDLTTSSGYLTVFAENDSTMAFRQAVSAASGADPVVGLDTQ